MSTPKLPVWTTFVHALRAPFGLEAASWKELSKPLLAVIIASLLPMAAGHFRWNETVVWLTLLLLWAALAMFALEFQRHLLLGAQGCKTTESPWRRYALYLPVLGAVSVLLAIFAGLLFQFVLPAVIFFMMAIDSSDPWLASATIVLWTLVVVVAAYPAMRISLIFPALSVSHDVAPKRIWHLTGGNGLRLLSLLVLIPGLINGVYYMTQPEGFGGPWSRVLSGVFETYASLVYLSILALAYRALSDQPLPWGERKGGGRQRIFNPRVLKVAGLVALAAIGAAAAWDAFYRVEPGEIIVVSRLGKHERVRSDAGVQLKIPFVEDAREIPKTDTFSASGEGNFLTMSKKTLPLKYAFQWQIVDGDAFVRTMAGQTRAAEMRVVDSANMMLRNEVARLNDGDVGYLRDAGKVKFPMDDRRHHEGLLERVLPDVNSRIAVLGIEVSGWEIETTNAAN